jgi:S1-C subfamily serine protease
MAVKFSNTFIFILLAIFFGALSGILGFIIVGAGNFKIPFVGTIDYAGNNLDNNIVIQQPRSVILEQDTQIKQIENLLLPTIINIYHTKKSTDPMLAAYNNSELLGHGFVLTADGWMVSTAKAINNSKGQYTAIGYQSKKYDLSNILVDSASGIVFTKTNASKLSVAKIGKSADLNIGQTVVVVSDRNQLMLVNIEKIGYDFKQSKDLVLGSDIFKKRIYLSADLDASYEGALLVNFKGEVVGLISGSSAIPADYFNSIVNQILSKQKITRAALGVDYIDLSQVDGLIEYGDKGAYVVYDTLKGTAAYGFVKKGDLIKKVNDIELNSFVGLTEAIGRFQANDRVELLISRGGQEMTVAVVLK